MSWLTPEFVPDPDCIPSGLQFGDGLFETLAVRDGRCVLWKRHWQRLLKGCECLGFFPLPDEAALLQWLAGEVSCLNGILKLMMVRHAQVRGYAYAPDWRMQVTFKPGAISIPDSVDVCTLDYCISGPALGGIKHMNRLDQVLANRMLGGQAWEGWVKSPAGGWVDGIRTNFLILDASGRIHLPDAGPYGVNGVMRDALLSWLSEQGVSVYNAPVSATTISGAQSAAVMNAIYGLLPVHRLNDRPLNTETMTDWRNLFNAWIRKESQALNQQISG